MAKRQRPGKSKVDKRNYNSLSKKEKKEYLKNKGYTYSEIRKNQSEIERQVFTKPKKRKKTKVDYRSDKLNWIESQGIEDPLSKFTIRQIDSIKISDIRKGTLTANDVPFLSPYAINYEKEIDLSPSDFLFFAYHCFSGNISLEYIIAYTAKKDNKTLMEDAAELMARPLTYKDGEGTSSGKDGEARFQNGDKSRMALEKNFINSLNRRQKKSKRRHPGGEHTNWQILSNGKQYYFKSISLRQLLIIYIAIAENVVETVRTDFTYFIKMFLDDFFPQASKMLPSISEIFEASEV